MTERASMSGRTCMITGASSGIGRATAVELARLGANLVLVCRDPGRGEDALAEVRRSSDGGNAELMLSDLASQRSIRALAAAFLNTGQPLHVLINNAGVVNTERTVTVDGIETVFAVNHLAYFLLTALLLDRLRESAPARIVNVASHAHTFGPLDFDDLGGERRYQPMRIYGKSKLANILFTYELARRLAGTGVTVNCLHPGAVATGLGSNNGAVAKAIISVVRLFFRSPENGARTSVFLASSPTVEGITGKYFVDAKEARSSTASYDTACARRLWDVSAALTGLALADAAPRA